MKTRLFIFHRKGTKLMNLQRILPVLTPTLIMFVVMVVMPATLNAQSGASKPSVEGTWNVVLTAPEVNFQQNERITFIPGRNNNEGSLMFSNEVDAVPPCGTDQGVWDKTGKREFTLTHGAFCLDVDLTGPSFTYKFREVITLNERGDEFTGRGVFEVFDLDGVVQFSAPYLLRGTRMQVEPVPAAPSMDAGSPVIDPSTKTYFGWPRRKGM